MASTCCYRLNHMDVNKQIAYTLNLLRPHQVLGYTKRRVGNKHHNAHVILDHVSQIRHVISLDATDNLEFDLWFANQGCNIIRYDVQPASFSHEKFQFVQSQVGPGSGQTCLSELLQRHKLTDNHNLLLNSNLKGTEWSALSRVTSDWHAHFQQMVWQFHDLHNLADAAFRDWVYQIWEQITRTHVVCHVHANQADVTWVSGVAVPPVIQVSFVRRDLGICVPSAEQFIHKWHTACMENHVAVPLGTFTFI